MLDGSFQTKGKREWGSGRAGTSWFLSGFENFTSTRETGFEVFASAYKKIMFRGSIGPSSGSPPGEWGHSTRKVCMDTFMAGCSVGGLWRANAVASTRKTTFIAMNAVCCLLVEFVSKG